ncbi:MAG: hypothetical protein Q4F83_16440 [Eubacteriales bacterium]|nr:hypothetical protein [Eubacteriales bacterium]
MMKKFAAILCAAVMSLGMVSSVMANPSIQDATIEKQDVVVAEETAQIIPEGKKLVVMEAAPDKYESKEAAEVVTKLNDPKTTITMKEMLDILKVDTTKEIKTESGNVINPSEYEPISKFADLVLTDGTTVEYDINGEVKAVKATVKAEALKDVKDIKDCVLMQIDPKAGEVYFIESDEESYVPETGEVTVTFPCLGPFCVLEKAE